MIQYPEIDPIALQIGPLAIRWYGLMYLTGFVCGWWLARYRARKGNAICSVEQVDDLVFYVALGVILGGRVGYVLFYNFSAFLDNPFMLFKIWEGGMSFHGGFLGVLLAAFLFARKLGQRNWAVADFVAPLTPIGLGAGRVGNFINGELWGRPTDLPWGMQVSCTDPGNADLCRNQLELAPGTLLTPPLHPAPLYEALLEGPLLFLIVWLFSARPRPTMAVSGVFLVGYGTFRTLVEFVRMPDSHIDYLAFGWLTMGHVLTLPMIIAGIVLLGLAYRRTAKPATG